MERQRAVEVCRLIAGLVVSDDDLDPREDVFIDRLLARFGIPASERELIFPIVDATEAASLLREMETDVKNEALDLLIAAAAADGKIAPEERNYLDTVAEVVGTAQEDLEKRLGRALEGAR